MTIQSIADITPNGTATALGAAPLAANWVALTATGTTCRWGDANIGAARGQKLPTGVPVFIPLVGKPGFDNPPPLLASIYVYAGSGSDAISVTYGI